MSSKQTKQPKLNPVAKLAQERIRLREIQEAEDVRLRLEEENHFRAQETERLREENEILERQAAETVYLPEKKPKKGFRPEPEPEPALGL
jgi:hypothetical protein